MLVETGLVWMNSGVDGTLGLCCRTDVSKLKFEGKTFYVIGIQKEVSAERQSPLTHSKKPGLVCDTHIHTHKSI